MHVDYTPDFPETNEAALAHTGKTFEQWFAHIEAAGLSDQRREAIHCVYTDIVDRTGAKDPWWPTTIWVAYDRARGVVVKKDGRPEGYNICCTKGFKQAPADLFPHFSSEAAMQAWIPGWSGAPVEGTPFRCGAAEGTIGRVRPAKDIRMAWTGPGYVPTEIEVQFNVMGGKTTINFYHKRIPTRAEADGLRRAWGQALDRLKTLVG